MFLARPLPTIEVIFISAVLKHNEGSEEERNEERKEG
jgi:hypothetical protein